LIQFVQVVDRRCDWCKRRAKMPRPARVSAARTLRPFYKRPVVYCNTDCKSCRRASPRKARCRVKPMLARRLRRSARRASGTLGSFSPPMNRVR